MESSVYFSNDSCEQATEFFETLTESTTGILFASLNCDNDEIGKRYFGVKVYIYY